MTQLVRTTVRSRVVSATVAVALQIVPGASPGQAPSPPVQVAVPNGDVTLGALLWRPQGRGPFPAILVNHGSGRTREETERLGPDEGQAENFGPVFARHGYVLLYLFRQGVGLSGSLGKNANELMTEAAAANGQSARNALQMTLLEGREMADVLAGLAFLRGFRDVDPKNIAVLGHSFGGSLTVLLAERDPSLRAAVIFSGAGYSWDRSPELRERLLEAIRRTSVPLFFIHAENDYSTGAGWALDAELTRLGKPHRLKIYPPVGRMPDDGHEFANNSVAVWEPEVFAFLDSYLRR
jgi:carboxymethylenebutenolidase